MTSTVDTAFESEFVHQVYDQIAQDFSRTRHSGWKFIEHFLEQLLAGSVVLDAGCGNGKYLGCNSIIPAPENRGTTGSWPTNKSTSHPKSQSTPAAPESNGKVVDDEEVKGKGRILPIGWDMSNGLLGIAAGKGFEAVRGDCFDLSCWREGSFDHAISIATIHHFITPERRMESVRQLILAVVPRLPPSPSTSTPSTSTSSSSQVGTVLICVWALEQDPAFNGKGSARRAKRGTVPISSLTTPADTSSSLRSGDEAESTSTLEERGVEKLSLEDGVDSQDVFVPWSLQGPAIPKKKKPYPPTKGDRIRANPKTDSRPSASLTSSAPSESVVEVAEESSVIAVVEKASFNRYYHLFRHFELSDLVRQAAQSIGATYLDHSGSTAGSQSAEEGLGGTLGRREGWRLQVELKKESWERENWVVEIGVRWLRVQ